MAALPHAAPREDGDLLQAFLAGDEEARDELPGRMRAFLIQMARRFAPEATRHHLYDAEDIVQETFRLLLGKDAGAYDPSKGSAETFLTLLLRNAVKTVRASFAPSGRTTRSENDSENRSRERPLSLDAPVPGHHGKLWTVAEVVADSTAGVETRVEAQDIIDKICRHAEPPIARAIMLFCAGEVDTWSAAAHAVNVKRWTLSRRLTALATDKHVVRLAA